MTDFSQKVLNWFDHHGRKNLPWQQNITPYRVWLSEIMLQQTQVKTVIPYFQRFTYEFADVTALANAHEDQVLKLWSGLGYYARARNLHKAAQIVRDEYQGIFPNSLEGLQDLPGIGRSTAGAILSIAHQQSHAILDGNVKRVLTRYHAVDGWTGKAAVLKRLWDLAEQHLPNTNSRSRDYTQAMMDLGATVCTRSKPACSTCPLSANCLAFAQGNMTDYPTPKKKQSLPERQTWMLLLSTPQQEVLLQKRPSPGIWGGLWCFPQFDAENELKSWLLEQDINTDAGMQLESFSHTFSHFRLQIHPLIVQSQTPLFEGVMEDEQSLWYNVNTEFEGGLAAPVQKLLNLLKADS